MYHKHLTDPVKKRNHFKEFYVSIADNILNERKYNGNKGFEDFLNNSVNSSFIPYDCDETEVKYLMYFLNPKKTPGPNSIPIDIHLLAEEIRSSLNLIVNLSFATGHCRNIFKIVKPIPSLRIIHDLVVCNYLTHF